MLIRAPQKFFNARFPQGPRLSVPIGLLAIASFLESREVQVQIFDAFVEGEQYHQIVEQGVLSKAPDKATENMLHFGASWDEVTQAISDYRPDIIGISAIFDETTEETLQAAKIARAVMPGALIIIGGPSASTHPDSFLEQCPEIDLVCRGDGEETTLELVEWLQGKRPIEMVSSVVYRQEKANKCTAPRSLPQELDHLGQLNYELVKLERYFKLEQRGIMSRQRFSYPGSHRAITVITSRGCPYACSFCSVHIHAGKKYRTFSPEHVLDHLETLVRKYGINHIHFEDDNLTLDRKRFMKLAAGILERDLKFTWDTPNGVHANTLSRDMMVEMKKTGCVYLIVAVESGDQWVIDEVINKKPMTIEHVLDAFSVGKEIGLDLQAFYVIGFPREKMKNIMTTLKFAMNGLVKWDVTPHVNIAMAYAGTDLYQESLTTGVLTGDDKERKSALGIRISDSRHMITTREFTPESMLKLNEKYHRKFVMVLFFKMLKFGLFHPLLLLRNLSYFREIKHQLGGNFKETAMQLFFARLLYPNALIRESTFSSKSRELRASSNQGSGLAP